VIADMYLTNAHWMMAHCQLIEFLQSSCVTLLQDEKYIQNEQEGT